MYFNKEDEDKIVYIKEDQLVQELNRYLSLQIDMQIVQLAMNKCKIYSIEEQSPTTFVEYRKYCQLIFHGNYTPKWLNGKSKEIEITHNVFGMSKLEIDPRYNFYSVSSVLMNDLHMEIQKKIQKDIPEYIELIPGKVLLTPREKLLGRKYLIN